MKPDTTKLAAALFALNEAVCVLAQAGFIVRLQDGSGVNSMRAQGATVADVTTEPVRVVGP